MSIDEDDIDIAEEKFKNRCMIFPTTKHAAFDRICIEILLRKCNW